jgi:hypothetical protein
LRCRQCRCQETRNYPCTSHCSTPPFDATGRCGGAKMERKTLAEKYGTGYDADS